MKLFYRELGGKGQPLIILHGLFGSSDNWLTQAKVFAEKFHVYMPDQRNHGQSPHSEDDFDYSVMADDIHEFLITNAIHDPIILGHSMGGKAAMKFALDHPELLSKLIVVDIAPKSYRIHHDKILAGLKSIELDSVQSRNEADELLSAYEPDESTRQFLLKNLQRKSGGGFSWKINLPVLDRDIDKISNGFSLEKTFEKPSLFIRGSRSNYVKEEDLPQIHRFFPQSKVVTLDTGHWVHAEKPREFIEAVMNFIG